MKITINNNNPFNINFDREITEANKIKEKRKNLQWNNIYEKKEEKDQNDDEDIDFNENDDEYNPSLMIFKSLNYVNINIKERGKIAHNYGNKHDIKNYNLSKKTIKIEQKRNKNKNNKRKQNKNNNYFRYKNKNKNNINKHENKNRNGKKHTKKKQNKDFY